MSNETPNPPLTGPRVESLEGRIGKLSDSSNPNSVMQRGLPQIPIDRWDEPTIEILGGCEGIIFNSGDITLIQGSGEQTTFSVPKQTRFVRIQESDGSETMAIYDLKKHGEWQDIPNMKMTPAQLAEELLGQGNGEITDGQQFETVRKAKGGASRKY